MNIRDIAKVREQLLEGLKLINIQPEAWNSCQEEDRAELVKSAVRAATLKYHPDKYHGNNRAVYQEHLENMQLINWLFIDRDNVDVIMGLNVDIPTIISTVKSNAEKLDDLVPDHDFSENNLTSAEEKVQFEKYCCAISSKIMTEPVYDPKFPQYQFEKADILRWLNIKQEHPFTKTPLKPTDLKHNIKLDLEIAKFVTATVNSFSQPTQPTVSIKS